MDAREKALERVKRLIAKGEEMAPVTDFISFDIGGIQAEAAGWRAQAGTLLIDLCGSNSVYTQHFWHLTKEYESNESIRTGAAILKSLREDIENGYMQTYRQRVVDELWEDLFEQANNLLIEDSTAATTAAAVVAGAALENGLRELAKVQGVTLGTKEDLSTLTGKLANSETVSRLEQKQLVAMADVRNAAAHGEVERFGQDDVAKLIRDARDFLAKHAT
ncbi:MAG: hypothetical protein OXC55_02440 [Chloroflexi bacterium]|nr:hypothetical protein [Chloroflexota bacterium]